MPLQKKRGDAAQVYLNAGTFAAPNPVALRVSELHFTDKPGKLFDASDRLSSVDTFIPTRSTWSIEFEFVWDASDTGIVKLVTAARLGLNADMIVTDDNILVAGTIGLHAEWTCESGWDNDAKLADGQKCKMKWVPAGNYTNPPVRWQTGGGAAPGGIVGL